MLIRTSTTLRVKGLVDRRELRKRELALERAAPVTRGQAGGEGTAQLPSAMPTRDVTQSCE